MAGSPSDLIGGGGIGGDDLVLDNGETNRCLTVEEVRGLPVREE